MTAAASARHQQVVMWGKILYDNEASPKVRQRKQSADVSAQGLHALGVEALRILGNRSRGFGFRVNR